MESTVKLHGQSVRVPNKEAVECSVNNNDVEMYVDSVMGWATPAEIMEFGRKKKIIIANVCNDECLQLMSVVLSSS